MRSICVVVLVFMSSIVFGQSDTVYYSNGSIKELITVKSAIFKKTFHWYYDEEGTLEETGAKIAGEKTGIWEKVYWYFDAKMYKKSIYEAGALKLDSTFMVSTPKNILIEAYSINADNINTGIVKCGSSTQDFDSTYFSVEKFYTNGNLQNVFQKNSNEELHGRYVKYKENGKIEKELYYLCGKKTGVYISYYPSGKKHIVTMLKDGFIDGSFIEYYENGKFKITGRARAGVSNGNWYKYNSAGQKEYKYTSSNTSNKVTIEKVDDFYWTRYYAPVSTPKSTYTPSKKKYKSSRSISWDPEMYNGLSITHSDGFGLWGGEIAVDNWVFGVQGRYKDADDDGVTHEIEVIKPYLGYAPKIYKSMFFQFGLGFNSFYESTYLGTNWDNPIAKTDEIGYTAFGGVLFNMIGDGSVGLVVGASVEYDQVYDGMNYMWKLGLSFN